METQYVVCTNNDGYPVSLETRKIYRVIGDQQARNRDLERWATSQARITSTPASALLPSRFPEP